MEGGCFSRGTVFKLDPKTGGTEVLHSFGGAAQEGWHPQGCLSIGPDGTLYGTTFSGGASDGGTVFRVGCAGNGYQVLYSFGCDETAPRHAAGDLVIGSDGWLYGATVFGGQFGFGTVFRLDPGAATCEILHSFGQGSRDGLMPRGGLALRDGIIYGTTSDSASQRGYGTVFKLNTDGRKYCILHRFNYGTAMFPRGGVVVGPDGALYGTTARGQDCCGTVFRLNPDGSGFAVLHPFSELPDGVRAPAGPLLLTSDANLCGIAQCGGSENWGAVFCLEPIRPRWFDRFGRTPQRVKSDS
jgi:uncharacterized repeat protein (TIGR03803 family)